jgi:LPXTG-motif cell wall-anchored protein
MLDRLKVIPLWFAATLPAYAQQAPGDGAPAAGTPQPPPGTDEMTGQLMFFTLGAGLLVAILLMLYFLRKRSNRAAAGRVFNPNERDRKL